MCILCVITRAIYQEAEGNRFWQMFISVRHA